jgi:hypothetical protein
LKINNKDSINKLETEKMEENFKPLKKQNFSWIKSEENIIQNHINIFKLLKACKIENLDPFKLKNIKGSIC